MADFAVCADGFVPLPSYNCRDCSVTGRRSRVALVAALVVALVVVVAALSARLMTAIDSGDDAEAEQTEVARTSSVENRWNI